MSRLKKMHLTTTYPRTAFAENTSLENPPHGLRVKISSENTPGCMACASPLRIFALRSLQACQVVQQWLALKFTIASPPQQACAGLYFRIAPATCAFALRLSRTYPRDASRTLTLLTSWHLRTALIISTFTLRLNATYLRA